MKKSELWREAMGCVINGDLPDEVKLDVLEMMMEEMHLAIYRETETAKKAVGENEKLR